MASKSRNSINAKFSFLSDLGMWTIVFHKFMFINMRRCNCYPVDAEYRCFTKIDVTSSPVLNLMVRFLAFHEQRTRAIRTKSLRMELLIYRMSARQETNALKIYGIFKLAHDTSWINPLVEYTSDFATKRVSFNFRTTRQDIRVLRHLEFKTCFSPLKTFQIPIHWMSSVVSKHHACLSS